MASIFPSGGHPDACKAGHSWARGSRQILVGSEPCDCRNALGNFRRHQWVKCIAATDGGECAIEWRDPPCSHLQNAAARPVTGED